MAGYVATLDNFKLRSVMPANYVDGLEAAQPGWLLMQDEIVSSRVNAKLRKRYAAPFADPVPPVVVGWVVDILTAKAYLRLGVDPTDKQTDAIAAAAELAMAEVQQAADAENGLFDLPLTAAFDSATGVVRGTPLVYSEQSPYAWTDVQRDAAVFEDASGIGGAMSNA
jgi:hypothetical protein